MGNYNGETHKGNDEEKKEEKITRKRDEFPKCSFCSYFCASIPNEMERSTWLSGGEITMTETIFFFEK